MTTYQRVSLDHEKKIRKGKKARTGSFAECWSLNILTPQSVLFSFFLNYVYRTYDLLFLFDHQVVMRKEILTLIKLKVAAFDLEK